MEIAHHTKVFAVRPELRVKKAVRSSILIGVVENQHAAQRVLQNGVELVAHGKLQVRPRQPTGPNKI